MIECSVAPRGRGVALLTGCREVRLYVVRIGRSVEIRLVTTHARCIGSGQIVVAIHVALRALQRRMRPGERESGRGVIEGRVAPGGGGVALLARVWEVRLHVVWIRRSLEVLQVATDAAGVRTRQVVVAIHVALRALQRRMRPGEREASGRVIERGVAPRSGGVTLLTGRGEV